MADPDRADSPSITLTFSHEDEIVIGDVQIAISRTTRGQGKGTQWRARIKSTGERVQLLRKGKTLVDTLRHSNALTDGDGLA